MAGDFSKLAMVNSVQAPSFSRSFKMVPVNPLVQVKSMSKTHPEDIPKNTSNLLLLTAFSIPTDPNKIPTTKSEVPAV